MTTKCKKKNDIFAKLKLCTETSYLESKESSLKQSIIIKRYIETTHVNKIHMPKLCTDGIMFNRFYLKNNNI